MGIARGTNIVTNGLIYGHDTGHNPSITAVSYTHLTLPTKA